MKKTINKFVTFVENISRIQKKFKAVLDRNTEMIKLFINNWKRVLYNIFLQAHKRKNERLRALAVEITRINHFTIERVAQYFIMQTKILHSI